MRKENIKNRNLFWFLTFIVGVVAFGSYYCWFEKQNRKVVKTSLGTCETPEEAYKETQKALRLVSIQLNSGIKNANTLKEYEHVTQKIFKK
ncbi:hypothetical protein [Flavobacterium oreochromis]|uniref:Uncharacterized protein n=2 Tax=Flavobacterium TaxID=237 RepID=A0A246G7R9_9FLAO|nr:hypothetical protein [Flavobacterium oreochromis]OWP74425.1 hypothetical protein BWG23_13985 [Flavobacterium oreochromis]OWP74605.1 hypothetical protein BWK62_13900 [Flavobacterium oreochromis]POR22884.1 hypothetical protein BWK58_10600 [Flavobacterium columnare]QYS85517.1 hypothetical protein JJC03_09815 [Flavobacterium oreochromis]